MTRASGEQLSRLPREAVKKLMVRALRSGDLVSASTYADEFAVRSSVALARTYQVTIPKLAHDLDQLEYLAQRGVTVDGLGPIIDSYRRALDSARQEHRWGDRWRITPHESQLIGQYYNRILHRPVSGLLDRALSREWSPAEVQAEFLQGAGVVVVDDFLTPAALDSLYRFCLESMIWFNNRYAHGRLGTRFARGFNSPLLVQIGQEIAASFPNLIGPDHRLRQIWAYKTSPRQPVTAPHADFAATNVNLWITPDEGNLDPSTGGLDIYDVEAPSSWAFERYNKAGNDIKNYLAETGAVARRIPYRANRAIVFNSDLFHATQQLSFAPAYEHRRINVTFLYGLREEDTLHAA